jgi:hypothetical protein
VGDDSHFIYRQKLLGEDGSVRQGAVMVKQPGLFSPKFGVTSLHVFMQSPQNVAIEPRIHSLACWDKFFVHSHLDVKESDDQALDIAFHLSGLFFGLGDVGLFH